MNWVSVEQVLGRERITINPLRALRPDRYPYSIMLYQHCGEVAADADGVRNADHTLAVMKFRDLFTRAVEATPDLLATPEYSCPWSALDELFAGGTWPLDGTAWVIGCESITPADLTALRDKHAGFKWVIAGYRADAHRRFLDPVCTLLTGVDRENRSIRIILVQFKCYPMADPVHTIEPVNMLLGTEAFVLRNNNSSISLAVLICSDTLDPVAFRSLRESGHDPFILLHLQLCFEPCHLDFSLYRREWGSYNMTRMQIVCLNWARQTAVLGHHFDHGGSAFFDKVLMSQLPDNRFNECHAGGLYYVWGHEYYSHSYLIGYDEQVLLLECDKTSQEQEIAPVRRRPTGPRSLSLRIWNEGLGSWQEAAPQDGFRDMCASVHADLLPLTDVNTSPAMRERLACLTSGDISRTKGVSQWHDLRNLPSLQFGRSEISYRVTFTHDPDEGSHRDRTRRVMSVKCIKHEVLRGPTTMPPGFEALRDQGVVVYPAIAGNYNLNVALPNSEYAATFIYIGDSSRAIADQTAKELTVPIATDSSKLVVWYRDNGTLAFAQPPIEPRYDRDPASTAVSIDKEVP